jgi:hypothetical protein
LAPGAALGSRLRVALSSGQVIDHFINDLDVEPLPVRAAFEAHPRNSRAATQLSESADWPNSVSNGTCPESDRLFRVRYTRSWAVVFLTTPIFAHTIHETRTPIASSADRWQDRLRSIRNVPLHTNFLHCRLTKRTLSGRCHPSRRLMPTCGYDVGCCWHVCYVDSFRFHSA